MEHDTAIEELVVGYRACVDAADFDVTAAVDAPTSTPFCVPINPTTFITDLPTPVRPPR
jgi:hypothetical protein